MLPRSDVSLGINNRVRFSALRVCNSQTELTLAIDLSAVKAMDGSGLSPLFWIEWRGLIQL
jgi:hypothetical protein